MKKSVLVCAAQAQFARGGAEILVRELRDNLARRGFRVEVAAVPFHPNPPSELVRQALAWRLLEPREITGRAVDLVIPTKFPSYLVRHPRKVAWLFHQHREAYDLYGTEFCSFTSSPEDTGVRDAIRTMDNNTLGECTSIFTISKNVSKRLAHFNQLPGTALYPPPQQLGNYRTDGYGDYLFYAGRLETLKRLDLAIEALAHSRRARLKIAGRGPLLEDLQKLAARLGVQERVDFLGFVSEQELLDLYAGCRAAYYTPVDEDYGYVTVESFLSRKPVLTTTDAGGPLEFVSDARNGLVSEPDAEAIGAAMDRIFELDETALRDMGEEGHRRVADISWDRVIDRLTESIR